MPEITRFVGILIDLSGVPDNEAPVSAPAGESRALMIQDEDGSVLFELDMEPGETLRQALKRHRRLTMVHPETCGFVQTGHIHNCTCDV